MPEISPQSLLEACPRCDYSLETMPVECRCPECGTTLDRRWQMIAPCRKSGWAHWRQAVPFIICAACGYAFALGKLSGWARGSRWGLVAASVELGLTLVICYITWRLLFSHPRGFLAASPQGLIVSHAPETHQLYAWSQIKGVIPDNWTMGMILKLDGERVRLPSRTFFRGGQEVLQCIKSIEKYRRSLSKHD